MNRIESATAAVAVTPGLGWGDASLIDGNATTQDPGASIRAANPDLCAPDAAFSYALCTRETRVERKWP